MKQLLAAVFAFAYVGFAQQSQNPPTLESTALSGYATISAEDLQRRVYVLASDSMEGRETSYPGQRKAAQYIASEFRRIGLKPLDSGATFFQHFDVSVTRVDPATSIRISLPASSRILSWGKEFISEYGRDTVITAPVAFIGHTDCEISDASGAGLEGRIVFVLAGKRNHVADTSRSGILRRISAQRREPLAAAVIIVGDDSGPAAIDAVREFMQRTGSDKGSMRMGQEPPPRSTSGLRFFIAASVADEILRSAGLSLSDLRRESQRSPQCTPILLDRVSLTVNSRIIQETRQTENVAGLLEGSDPEFRDQAIVVSSHFDHLGKTSNGIVYYGADDDASGTSAVIELAEAYSSLHVRPKRSILFLAVTGEEKGLYGSSYYASHPLIPLERTMADLNIDMIGRTDARDDSVNVRNYVYLIGADKISTELDSILVRSNQQTSNLSLDLTYNDDRDPSQYYRRSDHYNFALKGIPVAFFFDGTHDDYHRPTDTPDKLLYDRMADIVRVVYAAGWNLASMPRLLVKNVQQQKP